MSAAETFAWAFLGTLAGGLMVLLVLCGAHFARDMVVWCIRVVRLAWLLRAPR